MERASIAVELIAGSPKRVIGDHLGRLYPFRASCLTCTNIFRPLPTA